MDEATVNEITSGLGAELQWCEEHKSQMEDSEEYKTGFIAGLKYAIDLIVLAGSLSKLVPHG